MPRYLLKAGASYDVKDQEGRSLLDYAASYGDFFRVKFIQCMQSNSQ